MKKILIAGAVALACIVSAKADYLYWQATEIQYNDAHITDMATARARLFYTTDGGSTFTQVGTAYSEGLNPVTVDTSSIGFVNGNNYQYYMELATYDAYSDSYNSKGSVGPVTSYSAISAANMITLANNMASMRATWSGITATTKVVPEPTSGLMMLVGMVLLGLKRRRA